MTTLQRRLEAVETDAERRAGEAIQAIIDALPEDVRLKWIEELETDLAGCTQAEREQMPNVTNRQLYKLLVTCFDQTQRED